MCEGCNTSESIIMTMRPPTTETHNRIANNSQRGRARGAAGACMRWGGGCDDVGDG